VAPAEAAKISGTAKLWYGTSDQAGNVWAGLGGNTERSLFQQDSSSGDVYVDLKYSRKIMDNVTLNAGIAGISTLGLEGELVSGTFANHGAANPVGDVVWINEANVVIGLPSVDSFVKIGRQELDTPFFYSEKWNIATNTFDAAVVGNTSLPDTTLIAAWVGRGNGTAGNVVNLQNENFQGGHRKFAGDTKPAYAFAAINKSLENTTLQGWYYKIPTIAEAYWLQADTNIAGFDLGAQYAAAKLNTAVPTKDDTNAWAVKLGYGMDNWSAYAAYSDSSSVAPGTTASIDISNIATGHTMGSQSRLYTETYWNYGYVGAPDAQTYAVGASYDLGMAKLGAQYTSVDGAASNGANDVQELAITASTKVGPINADIAYIYDEKGINDIQGSTALIMLSLPYSL